ncbi:Piso0_003348 [Millerozyma farinosa CBS 7064]|uniref:Piso0_003348 protein n=1 Tax=Pichia sorbitophila (strain ATCC MYA-4447 / BCRC 22081 / CBS 7064 / NBRC 10061 / NRRL Y-12695) TaxID=559304 RepID=G8YIV0_PICSO|nr:Piso0_003348 [Millerozyma farinosa CBS 7064]CCE81010.1 Piso0_003348 [Millerozyma farinosa CBS 7064]
MYSPSPFSDNLYKLWGRDGGLGPSSANRKNYHHHRNSLPMGTAGNKEQNEEQREQIRQLFAPPLQAYSAEYPGASVSELEYTIVNQTESRSDTPLFTPMIQRKLTRLQQIRDHGYSTIIPIGVNKTMEQIDIDVARQMQISEHDEVDEHTVENAGQVNSVDGGYNSTANGTQDNSEVIVDLDADVPNADEEDEDDELDDSEETQAGHDEADIDDNVINEDEGFMAEEVEYQDDHSILTDSRSPALLVNSGTTGTTDTIHSNINSGRSVITNPTSVTTNSSMGLQNNTPSFLNTSNSVLRSDQDVVPAIHVSNDHENNIDQSDLDMVIDEQN